MDMISFFVGDISTIGGYHRFFFMGYTWIYHDIPSNPTWLEVCWENLEDSPLPRPEGNPKY